MKYQDLLNGSDQVQVQIIEEFFLSEKQISKKSLKDKFNITAPTLKAYIADINNEMNHFFPGKALFIEQENYLTLHKAHDLNLSQIIYHYIEKSDSFKILINLLHSGKLSYSSIEELMSISRTKAYREIAKINDFLSEFELSIHNGKLVGSELQIRYFYYILYIHLIPFELLIDGMNHPTILNYLNSFEAELGFTFSLESKTKLYVWLDIVRIRYETKNDEFDHNFEIEKILETSSFYKPLKSAITSAIKMHHLVRTPEDIAYLYLITLCFSIFPELSSEYLDWDHSLTNNKDYPINETLYQTDRFLRTHYDVSKLSVVDFNNIRFFIFKSVFHFAFFKGFIFSFNEDHFSREIEAQASQSFSILANEYLKGLRKLWSFNFSKNEAMYRDLLYHIEATLRYVDYLTDSPLKIGLRFHAEPLIQNLTLAIWENRLGSQIPIVLTSYNFNEKYDLVISDYLIKDKYPTDTYLTSELNNPKDIHAIKKIIKEIYEKNKHFK